MSALDGALSPRTRAFYRRSLRVLLDAGVPILVGGAYALNHHAGVERHTKDLDVFLRPSDRDRALGALAAAGYHTEVAYPHWLAKAYLAAEEPRCFIDLIYRSGNGLAEVDDAWFAHAAPADVLGVAVPLTPPEEAIWSKAFVMERERFDGADVAHLLHALGDRLDWDRLLRRFGPHWRVLLAHLVLFGFIYPCERDRVPARVLRELTDRLRLEAESPPPDDPVCQGTLLSRAQYLADIDRHGLEDGRVAPRGAMTPEDVAQWTEAIHQPSPTAPRGPAR